MLNLLCRKQPSLAATTNVRVYGGTCSPPRFLLLPPQNSSLIIRLFSSLKSPSPEQKSFTLSYLINSCGLSPEAATVASKKVSLKSPEKSDLLLTLLRNYGLSDAHIAKLVTKLPTILIANPEKTILPKLQLNLLQSDERVSNVFKRSAAHFQHSTLKQVPPNIAILRKYGVSESSISFLVVNHPRSLMIRSEKLAKLVNEVIELEIDISKLMFVQAIQVLHNTSKSAWEHKKEVYRRWGWSESDIRMAFSVHPICMSLSEKKIMSTMEFLVNEMNCEPKAIARYPTVLLYNLENRIASRCRVVKSLMVEGLIKKSYSLVSLIVITDELFLKRFVRKYQEKFPQLMDVYCGKLGLVDLGFSSSQLAEVKLL
ncbi:hypothetical protein BUALT_Bualt10G0052100 [Buddleja alternifolia]|uniref:Uncharacterized protein n=1 Tax=Buddleja alternifolia TaxID=168488 RepID=A0AAV6WVF1_9LAMI|nr:hypothetical protein BUALT_Bualt10G0052100 [Buddleja alternifolia]